MKDKPETHTTHEVGECAHENTEPHRAHMTGTPSQRCLDCGTYVIRWQEDGDE